MRKRRGCRSRRTEAEMRRWLARRSSQGWTWDELAARSGIPRSTLTWWSARLHREPEEEALAAPAFVEVEVLAPRAASRRSRYHLRLVSGHGLTVESGFEADEVRSLLRVLSEVQGP